MKKYISHSIAFITLLCLTVHVVHGQIVEPDCATTLCNPFSGGDTLTEFLTTLIDKIVLPIGAVIAVFFFILTGFKYVMAQGNPGKLGDANRSLLYTSIGTVILLGAWAIAQVIEGTVKQFQN